MNGKIFHLLLVALSFFVGSIENVWANDQKEESGIINTLPESQNQLIKLTDVGLVPRQLKMRKQDSIVFFLNDTHEAFTTVEIDYGTRTTHCASSNLKIEAAGLVHSVKPFGPKDFASVCFHDPGDYKFTVYGLKSNPKGITSVITVE